MWFDKFLTIIDSSWVGRAVDKRVEIVRNTDPENIFIENVRSFFDMPFGVARFFCDLGVRAGVFKKKVGLLCPRDKNIIAYLSPDEETPTQVLCLVCEAAEEEQYEFEGRSLEAIDVYSVIPAA